MAIVAELAEVLARSARRVGDRFASSPAMTACARNLVSLYRVPRRRKRDGGTISSYIPRRSGAAGLRDAAVSLGGRRRLVVVVSDFRFPEADITALMDALGQHDVVPVILQDTAEVEALPSWGLISIETWKRGRHAQS